MVMSYYHASLNRQIWPNFSAGGLDPLPPSTGKLQVLSYVYIGIYAISTPALPPPPQKYTWLIF